MNISAILVILSYTLLQSAFVFSAECTTDELLTISQIYSQATSDGSASCPNINSASDSIDYCSHTECLQYLSSLVDQLPDCTSNGVNARESLQASIDICDNQITASSSSSGLVTESSSSFMADSSFSSLTTDSVSGSTQTQANSGSSSSPASQLRTAAPSTSSSLTNDKITSGSSTKGSTSSGLKISQVSNIALAVATLVVAMGL